MRALEYFVATSIDGCIARDDGDFTPLLTEGDSFTALVEEYPETLPAQARQALGVDAANRRFDTVLMGRATYAPALQAGITSPYAHLRQYVASTTLPAGSDPQVTVVSEPFALIRQLKQEHGAGIWLAGGGRLAGALLEEIDELVIKRYPVVVGAGIPAIAADHATALPLEITDERTLVGGSTVTTYTRART